MFSTATPRPGLRSPIIKILYLGLFFSEWWALVFNVRSKSLLDLTTLAGTTEQPVYLPQERFDVPTYTSSHIPGRGKAFTDPATVWQVTKNVCHTVYVGFLMLSFVIIQNYKYNNASMFIYMFL